MIPGLLENSTDTKILVTLLRYLKSDLTILESGLFLGSWCINVNNHFQDKNLKFYGIDDLSFINNPILFDWYKNFNSFFKSQSVATEFLSIKTSLDLENYIKNKSMLYTNKSIDITVSESIFDNNIKFDVIHHDCANGYWSNDYFYKYYCSKLREDGLLVIDNFGCDVPMRTISISKYIENRTFYVVGSGKRKLFLSKNLNIAQQLIDNIKLSSELNSKFIFAHDYHFDYSYFYYPPDTNDL